MFDLAPFILTLKLSLATTLILFVIGIPIAYWLAYSNRRFKIFAEAIVAMPLVLPPSVLGFYILLALSPENGLGKFLDQFFNLRLVFTFSGLLIASVLYSLPFMVQPLQAGFQQIPKSLKEASYTLGKSRLATLWKVLLPNMKIALITSGILTFAHTIGEFGVVMMVGGNIPHETKVISIAIYDEVESMNYKMANRYSIIMLAFTFVVLISVYLLNYNHRRKTESYD
jgi:molybdate transport system permease protein